MNPDNFENGDFFIRLSLPSTRQRRFRAPKAQFFENGPQSGVFLKMSVCGFVWTNESVDIRIT